MPNRVWPRRLLSVLYWYLAVSFVVGAVTKYWPGGTIFGPPYSAKFEDWGYPPWFRFVVGSLELVCAVMLLVPRRRFRFIAGAALMLLLTGATTTHIVNHDPLSESLSAHIHLGFATVVALANWPADWRELLVPWQQPAPGASAPAGRSR